ncbi:MAG: hypothetical protein SFY95_09165 [Planctomycetota bacterium]|nr:hypothetical protein [Planctomycetota bacterium]
MMTLTYPQKIHSRSAFSLAELLVVIGVIVVLLSLALPAMSGARKSARALGGLANVRTCATALFGYAGDWRDLPPVYAPPSWPEPGTWVFDFQTQKRPWFDHGEAANLGLTEYAGSHLAFRAPNNQQVEPRKIVTHRGVQISHADYTLTNTAYAEPDFFSWDRHEGPRQFRPMPLSRVRFPYAKGAFGTSKDYAPGGVFVGYTRAPGVRSGVAFFDGSALDFELNSTPQGFFNYYAGWRVAPGVDPRSMRLAGIWDTLDGFDGRDR